MTFSEDIKYVKKSSNLGVFLTKQAPLSRIYNGIMVFYMKQSPNGIYEFTLRIYDGMEEDIRCNNHYTAFFNANWSFIDINERMDTDDLSVKPGIYCVYDEKYKIPTPCDRLPINRKNRCQSKRLHSQ